MARFLNSLARNELIKVELCRLATSSTNVELVAQCAEPGLRSSLSAQSYLKLLTDLFLDVRADPWTYFQSRG